MRKNLFRRTGRFRNVRRPRRFRRNLRRKNPKFKRVIKNTLKVKGMRKRLNTRPEMKWTLATWATSYLAPANACVQVWGSNDQWSSTPMINPPTSGTSQSQYIGTKINSLFCDVRFMFRFSYDQAVTNEACRIVAARSRVSGQDNSNYPATPTSILEPFDSKSWDVMFDKTYPIATGLTATFNIGGTGYLFTQNTSPAKYLRFRIPMRETLQMKNSRVIFEYPMIIWAISANASVRIYAVQCKFFYRDA